MKPDASHPDVDVFEEIQKSIKSKLAAKNLILKKGTANQLLVFGHDSGKKPVTNLFWGLVKIEGRAPEILIATIDFNDFNGKFLIKILKKDMKPLLDDLANEIHDQYNVGVSSTLAA